MRPEIEALSRLAEVADELEVGLADLAGGLDGEAKEKATRLKDLTDGLADGLTAIYLELAKEEVAQERPRAPEGGHQREEAEGANLGRAWRVKRSDLEAYVSQL